MARPVGTIRSLPRTEAQIMASGLSDLVAKIPPLCSGKEQTLQRTFGTETMAKRAQRLLYQWLWFYPDYKDAISLRVEGTILYVSVKGLPEKRGRRGRK